MARISISRDNFRHPKKPSQETLDKIRSFDVRYWGKPEVPNLLDMDKYADHVDYDRASDPHEDLGGVIW